MKNIGVIEDYECGVVYRVACWIDSLGIQYSVSPQVVKCLMLTKGSCTGDFRLELE